MHSGEQHLSDNIIPNKSQRHGHAPNNVNENNEFQWKQDLLQVIQNSKTTRDVSLTKAEATSICRQKGMGDSKIHELMSKLKSGGHLSLETLEELLRELPQGNNTRDGSQLSESNSYGSSDVLNEEPLISTTENNDITEQAVSLSTTNGGNARGTNFLELANTMYSIFGCTQFSDALMDGAMKVMSKLEEIYPKLKEDGGFEILRSGVKNELAVVVPPVGGYTVPFLRYESGLAQAMTYIRPLQSALSMVTSAIAKLHFAALASLKSEINDLQKKLSKVTSERDQYRRGFKETRNEQERLIRKYEARLHEQEQQGEQQVTELQSVIAELRKKLDQASVNCIAEEDEEEGTPSSDEAGNSSNASQGGSDQGDMEDAEMFDLNEQRTTDSDHVDEVHFNTLSKTNEKLQSLGHSVSKHVEHVEQDSADAKQLELSRSIFMQLQKKLTELKDQCQELEKKTFEKQVQQASVADYVSRKRSSEGNELQQEVVELTRDRDLMKTKVKKLEHELEKNKNVTSSLREERDSLRKQRKDSSSSLRIPESPLTSVSRLETSDGVSEPPSPRPSRSRSQPASAFTPIQTSHQNQSQFSPRLTRPRGSSTPTSPLPRGHSFNKTWQLGDSPGSSLKSMKNSPPGSVKSAQGVWKSNNVSSDLGSSVVSCPDAVLTSRQKKDSRSDGENELIEGLTGEKFIKILHQLPDFDKMPDSLVNTLQSCQTLRDVFHALHAHWTQQSCEQVREYQTEVEGLRTKLEHIRAQNNVVALSMEESKSNSEQLSLLIGKYESQCTALQVELELCDRSIDGYEALIYLLESEQEVLNTNCNADGIDLFRYRTLSRGGSEARLRCGDMYEDDDDHVASATYDKRRRAETQARTLLHKYDKGSDGNVSTGGSRPWEELSSVSRTSATSSTGSSAELDFNKEEEGRLRGYLARLRDERDTVRTTLMELQSVHDVVVPVAKIELDSLDARLDLENAVLLQELMALKEEKAELRAKVYLTEKEKKALELRLSSREAQEQAYVVHIEHLKSEVKDQIRKRRKLEDTARAIQGTKTSDGDVSSSSVTPAITLAELRTSDEDIPADLYEAARREKKLKSRIRELVDTLENLSKNSESRHQQAGEYIADLKRANGALVAAYEKAKRKHTARVKKLESQMMAMMEKHEKQISSLRERISMQVEPEPTHPNETAL